MTKMIKKKNGLIKNYGLFWEHDLVKWNKKPSLLGYSSKKKKCCFDDQIGIYVLYNENKEIIYVGQAGNGNASLLGRLKNHNRDHLQGWWTYFSWFGLIGTNSKGTELLNSPAENFHSERNEILDSLEGIMIAAINPKLNKQGEKLGLHYKQFIESQESENQKLLKQIELLNKILCKEQKGGKKIRAK